MTKVPVSQTTGFPVTKSYESPEQSIVSAGSIVLAHGLGEVPKIVQAQLVFLNAVAGYGVGQTCEIDTGHSNDTSTNGRGMSIRKDATNLAIRFGNGPNVFVITNATTGNRHTLTSSDATLVVRAFA